MSTPRDPNHIDTAIKARARDLRKTLDQVAEEAGITKQTLRAIRRGENRPFYKTANGIEDSLQWERGGLYTLLDGGTPTPLPDEPEQPVAPTPIFVDPYEAEIMALNLPLEDRQAIVAEMRAEKDAKLAEAKAKAEEARRDKGANSA